MSRKDLLIDGAAVLSAIPVPIFVIDDDNVIAMANENSEIFFARGKSKLEGRPVAEVVKFNDQRINNAIANRDDDLSAQNMEILTANGAVLVDVLIGHLSAPENMRLLIMRHRNRRDYIGDHSEAGDQMAVGAPAILSHEIKNPLAGIKGAAQFLSKNSDPGAKAMTDLIVAEVDRIARLLDQMQNLGNKNIVKLSEENIHIILDQAVQSIRVANPQFSEIFCFYDPSLPNIFVDYDAVLQILINILQNAVDACADQDDPKITISTRFVLSGALRRSDQDTLKTIKLPIEVSITDNGPGIPEHIENELFTPFVSTKREGQGLGLAIVRKFVRQLNSRILHERDEEKQITIFRLLLPIATHDEKNNDE